MADILDVERLRPEAIAYWEQKSQRHRGVGHAGTLAPVAPDGTCWCYFVRTILAERSALRAQLDAVERAYSLAQLGSLPGRHGDRSIQPLHWKALGDAIRTAPKAPTTTPTEESHAD